MSVGAHPEQIRYDLFLDWCNNGNEDAYTKLYELLMPIAEGYFVRRLWDSIPWEDRKQEGCVRLGNILQAAREKHKLSPFNSLKGLNCYIMLGFKGELYHRYRDEDTKTHIDNTLTIAVEGGEDFKMDYGILRAKLTVRQQSILDKLTAGYRLREITAMLLSNHTTIWKEINEIARIMAPLNEYFTRPDEAVEFTTVDICDDDDIGGIAEVY